MAKIVNKNNYSKKELNIGYNYNFFVMSKALILRCYKI
jgi:hypothetical protein